MYETKALFIIGIITVGKFTRTPKNMQEAFTRDYQVFYIQCMQNILHQYISNNVWAKQAQTLLCILKELYIIGTKNVTYDQ